MGDGVLVYFGYPRAHEDDAARAVRPAWHHRGLRSANERQRLGTASACRRASASIPAWWSWAMSAPAAAATRRRSSARRPTSPRACRPEPQPDTVVIGAATRRLVESQFAFEDSGRAALKGVSRRRSGCAAYRARRVGRPLRCARARGLTPLVGRAAELEHAAPALAAGARRRDALRAAGRRGRHRQVARDARLPRRAARGAAPVDQLLLLALLPQQRRSCRCITVVEPRAQHRRAEEGSSAGCDRARQPGRAARPGAAEAMPSLLGTRRPAGDDGCRRQTPRRPSSGARLLDVLVGDDRRHGRAPAAAAWSIEDAHWIDPSTLELLRSCRSACRRRACCC